MLKSRPAEKILDETFLHIRAQMIDIGATLDRIDRSDHADQAWQDPRLKSVLRALEILQSARGNRSEQIQMLFSDEYADGWNAE